MTATAVTEASLEVPLWLRFNAVTDASHHVEGCLSYKRPKSADPFGAGRIHHVSQRRRVQMVYPRIVQMYDYYRSTSALAHFRALPFVLTIALLWYN